MQLVSGGRSQCGFDPLRGGDMYMCTAQIDKTLTLRHTNWRAGQCQVAHGRQKVPTFGLEDGTHSKLPDLVVSAVAQLQVRLVVEPAQHWPVTVTAIMALASIPSWVYMLVHFLPYTTHHPAHDYHLCKIHIACTNIAYQIKT